MMEIFSGVLQLNWCTIYLDDIIIFVAIPKGHLQHLWAMFEKLQAAGLKMKLSKCECELKLFYLGHVVSKNGMETDHMKIEAN